MADFAAIHQLLNRFACAHDDCDLDALRPLLSREATLFGRTGRDDVLDWLARSYRGASTQRRHVVTNVWLSDEQETSARAHSYLSLFAVRGDVATLQLTGARTEGVVLEEGAWRIRDRVTSLDVPYTPDSS